MFSPHPPQIFRTKFVHYIHVLYFHSRDNYNYSCDLHISLNTESTIPYFIITIYVSIYVRYYIFSVFVNVCVCMCVRVPVCIFVCICMCIKTRDLSSYLFGEKASLAWSSLISLDWLQAEHRAARLSTCLCLPHAFESYLKMLLGPVKCLGG